MRKANRKNLWAALAMAAVGVSAMVQTASAATVLDLILASGADKIEIKLDNFDNGTIYGPITAGAGNAGTAGPGAATDAELAGGIGALDLAAAFPSVGAVGSADTWGVYRVREIFGDHDSFNAPIWSAATDPSRELTGMFYGTTDYFVTASGNDLSIDGVGMEIVLFEDTTPDWNQSPTPAGLASVAGGSANRGDIDDFNTATDTGADGILDGDAGAHLVLHAKSEAGHINEVGVLGGPASEFQSEFNTTSNSGGGTAFLSALGGTWAPFLNSNTFLPSVGNAALGYLPADIRLVFTTEPTSVGPAPDDWLVRSNDPITGFVTEIPEPSTIALVLLGAAAIMRRPSRRNAA